MADGNLRGVDAAGGGARELSAQLCSAFSLNLVGGGEHWANTATVGRCPMSREAAIRRRIARETPAEARSPSAFARAVKEVDGAAMLLTDNIVWKQYVLEVL